MPTGVYIRTEEHRKKLSKVAKDNGVGKWMKGRNNNNLIPFCKNHIPWNKGKKGLQIAWNKGQHIWNEKPHPRGMLGKIPWSKLHPELCKPNSGSFKKGLIPWDAGTKGMGIVRAWNKGKKLPHLSGENACHWKGGISRNQQIYRERRLQRMRIAGEFSIRTIQQVYEDNIKKFGTLTCIYCLKPIEFGNDTLEHKQPLSRGGSNQYENLAIACQKCNCKKHNKTEEEFRKIQIGA